LVQKSDNVVKIRTSDPITRVSMEDAVVPYRRKKSIGTLEDNIASEKKEGQRSLRVRGDRTI